MKHVSAEFLPAAKKIEIPAGTTVLAAAQHAGLIMNSPCGGEGICRKCRVRVKKGEVSLESRKVFTEDEQKAGYVLACEAKILGDVTIEIPPESRLDGKVMEIPDEVNGIPLPKYEYLPLVRKHLLKMSKPTLEDNQSDLSRVVFTLSNVYTDKIIFAPLGVLKTLPDVVRAKNWEVTVTVAERGESVEIIKVESGDTLSKKIYALAVDIGTTTVAVSLLDLSDGDSIDKETKYNSQITFGDDVISRILHSEKEGGLEQLRKAVIGDVNELIKNVTGRFDVPAMDIVLAVFAGNTTMEHIALGINPKYIRREPYISGSNKYTAFRAEELGLAVYPGASVEFLPSVGSYVGADITSGVLSLGLHRAKKTALFIDIGTNGEIVLGNAEWLICCSASAGPAFEGSGITCGMRAADGAIYDVRLALDGEATVKTVDGSKPRGICGTGLIDLLAELSRVGLLDRGGKFDVSKNNPHITVTDGEARFTLVGGEKAAEGRGIFITQSDVTNLVRSKGAIYAACKMLLKSVNLDFASVDKIFVAGGFGSHIDVNNAVSIGLLPDVPREKIVFMGNTSLRGAQLAAFSAEAKKELGEIADKMTYYELSTDKNFMDEFVAACFIPHTNIQEFPGVVKK